METKFIDYKCLQMELGMIQTVKARFWPWLQPFFRWKALKPFEQYRGTSVVRNRHPPLGPP
jgi:hypothetical protein